MVDMFAHLPKLCSYNWYQVQKIRAASKEGC